MTINPQLSEYFTYRSWFAKEYPALNKRYWQYITIPASKEGVDILIAGLDKDVLEKLLKIKNEYYNQHSGSKEQLTKPQLVVNTDDSHIKA